MMISPIYHNKYKELVWFLLDTMVGENLAGKGQEEAPIFDMGDSKRCSVPT
ncbi:hypothetical protein [Ralstonia insidiosa]|uniref:Uncharacterized protein n=1 Tax=Ralstonia insidiosa TaxID=190721 RepID=A0A848P000_9RALS|nr:hypothetical protein [Ralstonia insidiosa]NMV38014.1 hypothetical protein [Ralstonia insidiosa]